VLNHASHVRIRNTEIGELLGKELVDLLDFPVIPKLLKVTLDAFLVGPFCHEDSSNYLSSIHPFATVEAGKNSARLLSLKTFRFGFSQHV
jgi:hypothetical protein